MLVGGAEVNRIFAHGTNWTLHTAAWSEHEDCSCRKVAARVNGTICDSTLADFEEDERSFLVERCPLCANFYCERLHGTRHLRNEKEHYWDEHRLCLARLTFCHSLICLNYTSLSYFMTSMLRWNFISVYLYQEIFISFFFML